MSKRAIENPKTQAFLSDLIKVCEDHQLSISHEDYQGAFIIEDFDDSNIAWLNAAFDETGEQT